MSNRCFEEQDCTYGRFHPSFSHSSILSLLFNSNDLGESFLRLGALLAWRTTMFIEQRTGCERIIVKAEQLLALERDQSFKDLAEWQVVKLT